MPEMDGLQATRFIRTFENTGCWDASVKPEDNEMIANSAISSDCVQDKKGKRVPIIAVSLLKQFQIHVLCLTIVPMLLHDCLFL